MGTMGKKIVGVDVRELVEKLNKALADEWLAYYQYWVGAKVVKGCCTGRLVSELTEHAGDELRHAEMLVQRIIQLGGVPIVDMKELFNKSACGYAAPLDFASPAILKQNIKGEQCAIAVYHKLIEFVKGKDDITYHMLVEILKDEIEHEDDLEQMLENSCERGCTEAT